MSTEGDKSKASHQIVTRPYRSERYSNSGGVSSSSISLTEIDAKKAEILDKMNNFSVDIKTTPTSLMNKIMDSYNEKFGESVIKPNIFLHLIQKENLETLAPKIQIYVSDMILGNLNRDGFYRTIFESNNPDLKKTKRFLSEALRFYWADVVEIRGVCFGYRVNPK